jgi:uncharacterized membrane protein YccC
VTKFFVPAAALAVGLALVAAWAYYGFGDWVTFLIGALLASGGAFWLLDEIEERT